MAHALDSHMVPTIIRCPIGKRCMMSVCIIYIKKKILKKKFNIFLNKKYYKKPLSNTKMNVHGCKRTMRIR